MSRPRPSGPTPSWATHRQPARPAERTAARCRWCTGSRRPAECSTAAAQSAAELSQGVCGGVQGGGSPAGGIWDPLRRRRGVPGAPRCRAADGPLGHPQPAWGRRGSGGVLDGGGPDRRASCTVPEPVEVRDPVRAAGEAGVPAGARDGSRSRPPRRWPPAGSDGEKAVRHVDAALGGGLGGFPGRRGIWDAHRHRWGGRGGSRGGCLRTCTGRARPCFGAPPPTPEKCGSPFVST